MFKKGDIIRLKVSRDDAIKRDVWVKYIDDIDSPYVVEKLEDLYPDHMRVKGFWILAANFELESAAKSVGFIIE